MNEIVITSQEQLKQIIKDSITAAFQENSAPKNKPVDENPEYITASEVQRFLKISKPTLIKRMKDKTLPFIRIGRRVLFDRKLISEVLNSGQNKTSRIVL